MGQKVNPLVKLINDHPYILLTLFASALFFPLLGSYPVLGQWEPHYGRVVMEMLASDSWDFFLDPIYLGKHNFWSKPIFCFWMVLPFYKIFGPTELATRLPFAINGIFGILLTYYIVKRVFNDHGRAFLSALILMLTPYYFLISKQFMWDITTVTFLFGAIMFLYLGVRDSDKKLIRIAYVFLGIVMLTKGLLAIILPGGIFLLWMLINKDWENNFEIFKKLRLHEGAAIFLAVAAPWYIYMGIKHGMPFYREFFGVHHFGRMDGSIKKPGGPFEYYVWQLSIGTFPWIIFFIPALFFAAINKKERKEEIFLILSFFFIFLFFTLSGTKFPHYIFPAIPFFAITVSLPLLQFFKGKKFILYPATAIIAGLTIGVIAKDMGTGMNYSDLLYIITTHKIQKWFGRVYDMLPFLRIFVPLMALFIMLPLIKFRKKLIMKISIIGFFLVTTGYVSYLNFYFIPGILEVFTPKKLVTKFLAEKKEGDILVDYNNWKNRSIYFYMGLENRFERAGSVTKIVKTVEKNPEKTIYITTKKSKVPEMRSVLMSKLGVPLTKVADDRVESYMEIELYKTSMKDKGSAANSKWRENLINEQDIPKNIKKVGSTIGDGKIEYIGYKINKKRFNQNDKMELTVYYKVLKEIKKSYKIFFHFDVYQGALPYSFKIDEYPLEGYYPTNQWKPGNIIKQTFTKTIPSKHPGGGIKIYTGFYKGNRMKVDQANFNDGENRFILGTFRIRIK